MALATTVSGWPSITSSAKALNAFPTPSLWHCTSRTERKTSRLVVASISPMWHPLRLAEDFATVDILTGGRIVFAVGRGYHTREVETFGSPLRDQEANRALFEEQVD